MATIPVSMDRQIVNIKSKDISYRNLHQYANLFNTQTNDTIEIPYMSIAENYRDYLKKIVQRVVLRENDKIRFRYNPKRVSSVFYNGTTEYWYLIMTLNECVSVSDFGTSDTLKIYNPQKIKSYINEIMVLEDLL